MRSQTSSTTPPRSPKNSAPPYSPQPTPIAAACTTNAAASIQKPTVAARRWRGREKKTM